MGELLLTIQKQHGNQYTSATSSDIEKAKTKTKTEITSEMGMTRNQVSQYQQMADNPEVVCSQIVFQTSASSFVRWQTPINDYRAFSTPMQHQTSGVFTTQKENPHKYNVETTIA